MLNNKMFYDFQPDFGQIIDQIKKLENKINNSIQTFINMWILIFINS